MGRLSDLFSVAGRVALVTGGTSGIGLMIARAFVESGANVYVVGRQQDVCARTSADLARERGGACVGLQADLSTVSGIEQLSADFRSRERHLDILVNSAGVLSDHPLGEFTEAAWDDVLSVNIKAPFFTIQSLLPQLLAGATPGSPARIINIGSIGGIRITPRDTYAYMASKSGLHHLTRALARKLGPRHITVNAIAPGPFPSRMMHLDSEEMHAAVVSQIPLGRIGAEDDMAGAALFFASRAGAFANGVIMALDGGITA